jgi:hypothetical protein
MSWRQIRKVVCAVVCGGALLVGADASAIIGAPWTPISFAGAARRSVRRTADATAAVARATAVGAAAAGAAATGAAIAGTAAAIPVLPAGCMVGVPCGGIVYRPVFQGATLVYVP